MLEHITSNGSDRQRRWAVETMARDQSLRMARLQVSLTRPPGGPAVRSLGQGADGEPDRTVSDAGNREDRTGAVVRREDDPPSDDVTVNEAFDGLGATYTFFSDVFSRDSIDDEALPLLGVVHFGNDYDNAFWDGERMVFGDGDGELFVRFTKSLDVIGHELAHGVTQDEAGLRYFGQSGALNESMSDVFGSLVRQFKLGQKADEADWLIGADLLGPAVEGDALRSMAAPGTAYDDNVLGKDPQPAHMDDFVRTFADNGGVHINSGIPNKAFHRVAVELGGNAWERAGLIWYEALRDPGVRPTARFNTFARYARRAASRLYGEGSAEETAVRAGWSGVGIEV